MSLILTGGRVIDPVSQTDIVADVVAPHDHEHALRPRTCPMPRKLPGAVRKTFVGPGLVS